MNKYYEYINKTEIRPAPYPLPVTREIDGKEVNMLCCTNSEEEYNKQGYYRLENEPYPNDTEYVCSPYYELVGNVIYRKWQRGEKLTPETDKLDNYMKAVSQSSTVKSIREAAQVYCEASGVNTDEQ